MSSRGNKPGAVLLHHLEPGADVGCIVACFGKRSSRNIAYLGYLLQESWRKAHVVWQSMGEYFFPGSGTAETTMREHSLNIKSLPLPQEAKKHFHQQFLFGESGETFLALAEESGVNTP